jgi:hypothetical protein
MHQPKFSWSEYFPGSPNTQISRSDYNSRQTPSGESVYVSNCLFRSITTSSNGGALCCTSVTYFLVEFSSFFSCQTSSSHGGAVYFSNTGSGQCVVYGICGNDCSSTYTSDSYGQFAWILVNNIASNNNYFNYSSISRCLNENSNSRRTLFLNNGKVCCQSVNISMNKCGYRSGIYFYPLLDSNLVTCSLSFSTFSDNFASKYTCIHFYPSGGNYEINCCNIIRNKQTSLDTWGTIRSNGNLMIETSCILENIATYIFYQGYSYTITLSNCTVDSTSNNGYLTTKNTVTKSFILGLHHISTRNCHSEYDSAGYLTAIPYIPDVSHPTNKVFCHTCKINHCQIRISDFFLLLNCVFMFTFIHPNPS